MPPGMRDPLPESTCMAALLQDILLALSAAKAMSKAYNDDAAIAPNYHSHVSITACL